MGFMKKIASFLAPASQEDQNAVYVYVKCNRCGEKLRARISTRSELSPEFDGSDTASSFYCRKVLIGEKRCYQPIEINLTLDKKYRIKEQQISGGEFIAREEYEQE
jgi:hypothetical protein